MEINETPKLQGTYLIEAFEVDADGNRTSDKPVFVQEQKNLITNAGGAHILDALIGAAVTAFNNANAHIGSGDSATAAAVGQTDLQAATNKLRRAMQATFPSRSGQVMTFKSTFATGDANWTWNELGLFNNATNGSGTMVARAVIASPFTKTSALSIDVTYTLQIP